MDEADSRRAVPLGYTDTRACPHGCDTSTWNSLIRYLQENGQDDETSAEELLALRTFIETFPERDRPTHLDEAIALYEVADLGMTS